MVLLLSPPTCVVLLAYFRMRLTLGCSNFITCNLFFHSFMVHYLKYIYCDTKLWATWREGLCTHLSFPSMCSAVCTGMNDVLHQAMAPVKGKDLDCIPVQNLRHLGKPGVLTERFLVVSGETQHFATCLTFTERTEVEFSQDLMLRLCSKFFDWSSSVTKPKVSGGSVSFWQQFIFSPLINLL